MTARTVSSAPAISTVLLMTGIPGLALTPEIDRNFNPSAVGRRNSRARHRTRTIISLFLMIILAISMMTVLSQWPQGSDYAPSETPAPARIMREWHENIHIYGNDGFLGLNASTGISWGSGTESDPYIIEGWDIDVYPENDCDGITIRDTNAYFIVRNCYVDSPSDRDIQYVPSGIILNNCSNGILNSNTITRYLLYGAKIVGSDNITISNNRFNCTHIWYKGMDCDIGISGSYNITISNNICSTNPLHPVAKGISLSSSSNCTIEDNNCSLFPVYGITLGYGSNNVVTRNVLYENTGYGVGTSTHSSGFWNNTFYHNNGAGDTFDLLHLQALDYGTNNWWNSSDGYGNNWSDWRGPDLYPMDGIVDYPYPIYGPSGSLDYYPIAEYYGTAIPEFGMTPLVVMVFLVATVMTARARRRKAS